MQQFRTVVCLETVTRRVSSPSLCSGSPPVSAQSCSPTITSGYAWYPTSWSSCGCQNGTRTREVYCRNVDSLSAASDSLCTAIKPPSIESCPMSSCELLIDGITQPLLDLQFAPMSKLMIRNSIITELRLPVHRLHANITNSSMITINKRFFGFGDSWGSYLSNPNFDASIVTESSLFLKQSFPINSSNFISSFLKLNISGLGTALITPTLNFETVIIPSDSLVRVVNSLLNFSSTSASPTMILQSSSGLFLDRVTIKPPIAVFASDGPGATPNRMYFKNSSMSKFEYYYSSGCTGPITFNGPYRLDRPTYGFVNVTIATRYDERICGTNGSPWMQEPQFSDPEFQDRWFRDPGFQDPGEYRILSQWSSCAFNPNGQDLCSVERYLISFLGLDFQFTDSNSTELYAA